MSIEHDGSSIRVDTAGDPGRPVIVLLHGTMDRSAGMLRLSRRLDHDHFVIRYDRRGYGRSAGVGPPYSLDAHIDDLAGVIDEHAPDRCVDLAFGHSFGGNVVLGLAGRTPGRIRRVAVYETPMSWFDWWPGNTAGGAARGASDPAAAAEAFMRRLVGDDIWERLPASTRMARRAEGSAMVDELTDLALRAPWNPADVTVPVMSMSGEHGRGHHQRGMRLLLDLIENSVFVQLDAAGHDAPITHAVELADVLRSFVTAGGG